MPGQREGRIPFRGFETWYRMVGDPGSGRTPLVALHGGPGGSHRLLRGLEALADERAVVLYDQLGSGSSSQPSDPSLWTIDLFVDELRSLRAGLELERIHLLGTSWGGMLALEYALTQPDGLESLVLSSTPASTRLWADEALRLREGLPAETRKILELHEREGTTSAPEYEEAALAYYRKHVCRLDPWPESVAEAIASIRREVYTTMWGPNETYPTGTLTGWDPTPRLGEIRVPTLVTCGRYDEATPRQAEVLADGIADAELVVFEESAHVALIEQPDEYLAAVRRFLACVESQTRSASQA